MKNYFISLLRYDQQSNLNILDVIFEAHQPTKAVQIMAHLLAAQQIWLQRCKSQPAPGGPLWPDWEAVQLKYFLEENSRAWINYIDGLNDNDLDRSVTYQNLKGEQCTDKLIDVLTHLVNHGTHHRAQIGQQLKLGGMKQLPATDYILYARTQKQ